MASPDPIALTDEIAALLASAIDDGSVMLLAAVDAEVKPVLSYRGSTSVFSPTQLSVWARNAEGGTMTAIAHNPNVAMAYRSAKVPVLQFAGRARVTGDPAERERAFILAHEREQKADPERKGAAIIIDLDSVKGVLGFKDGAPIFVNMARADG